MKIIPAIDILGGQCTRLFQGDYSNSTVYPLSVQQVVENYIAAGANHVHIVDLSAARDPNDSQLALIADLVRENNISFQVGGGIRSLDQVKALNDIGVKKVIIGSLAVSDFSQTQDILRQYPETILAADLHIQGEKKFIATHGWKENSNLNLSEFLSNYPSSKTILCTDISKDGTLTHPNFDLYKQLVNQYSEKTFIASGGVSCLQDLRDLKSRGVQQVVIGKALFEGRFELKEALLC